MERWKKILIHVACWGLFSAFIWPNLYRWYTAGDWQRIWNQLIYFPVLVTTFYYCYSVMWPRINMPGKRWQLTLWFPLTFFVFWLPLAALHQLPAIFGQPVYVHNVAEAINLKPDGPVKIMVFSFVIWGFQEARKWFRVSRLLRQEHENAEMDFLRSQFNPHFLFNMLNSLHNSIAEISLPHAKHVERIADLMSYAITVSEDRLVTLETEVAQIRNYTELFRIRFEPRFNVQVEVTGNTGQVRIPPLLLMPFVENAFKHGILNDPDNPVLIRINVQQAQLELSTWNRIGHHYRDRTSGVGLQSIKRRLQLAYPGRHLLKINQEEDTFSTHLTIRL